MISPASVDLWAPTPIQPMLATMDIGLHVWERLSIPLNGAYTRVAITQHLARELGPVKFRRSAMDGRVPRLHRIEVDQRWDLKSLPYLHIWWLILRGRRQMTLSPSVLTG